MNAYARTIVYSLAGLLVVTGVLVFAPEMSDHESDPPASVSVPSKSMTQIYSGPSVTIDGLVIPVEIARTFEERERGLSGRTALDAEGGMLFLFPNPGRYRFWMPDMHFPIDIVWIKDSTVIAIDANVSPEFDPENPVYYTPPGAVDRVLELNAGFAEKYAIRIGSSLTFNHIE